MCRRREFGLEDTITGYITCSRWTIAYPGAALEVLLFSVTCIIMLDICSFPESHFEFFVALPESRLSYIIVYVESLQTIPGI